MVKLIFKTLIASLVFFGSWVIIMYLWKAWNDSTLKATSWDELTAERWNALVDKAWWKVYVSDWFDVTIDSNVNLINRFNTYAINHNLWSDNIQVTVFAKTTDDWEVSVIRPLDMYSNSSGSVCFWYTLRNILTNSFILWFPRDYCTSRYLFNAYDSNTLTTSPTSWKIKVMVRAY